MNSVKGRPVIIIGAARSGTKVLRQILSASEDLGGYPYDTNYIWRYGNYGQPHDELDPAATEPEALSKIRSQLLKGASQYNASRLLEKTVSNSLRVDFVKAVFPDAQLVHIHRNGYEAVRSTLDCWRSKPGADSRQLAWEKKRKLLEFPFAMAAPYLLAYGAKYAKKIVLGREYVDSWGPRYEGIDDDVRSLPLSAVCANQWARCVERSAGALRQMVRDVDYINVEYESLVASPQREAQRLAQFTGVADGERIVERAKAAIDPSRVRGEPGPASDWSEDATARVEQGMTRLRAITA